MWVCKYLGKCRGGGRGLLLQGPVCKGFQFSGVERNLFAWLKLNISLVQYSYHGQLSVIQMLKLSWIYVTSFSVFYTVVNSEYWSQKCTQNGNIHSIELDVYAEKQSTSNLSFILPQLKQGRKYYALASSPLTTHQNWYDTRSDRLDVLHAVMNRF